MDKMADSDLVSEPGPSLSDSSACSGTSSPTPSSSAAERDPNDGEAARSLITVLKAPTQSALCRPHKVAVNHLPRK